MKAIVRGDPLRFRSHRWKSISQSAKDLITKMLDRNVSQRPTATELMEDQWFIESLKLGAV
jgi:serine/threonine protein kinase